MKDDFIKATQKFLNGMFFYSALLTFTDTQKDFLLRKEVLEKTDDCEYNAMWDTLLELEKMFLFAKSSNLFVGTKTSVSYMFAQNLQWRKGAQPMQSK